MPAPEPLTVIIHRENKTVVWSFRDGIDTTGLTSMEYLIDGTQQRIIDALLSALVEARGQLRSVTLGVANVVPYVRPPTSQVDNCVPVA